MAPSKLTGPTNPETPSETLARLDRTVAAQDATIDALMGHVLELQSAVTLVSDLLLETNQSTVVEKIRAACGGNYPITFRK